MKAIQKFSKTVFLVVLLIFNSSCSEDDNPLNDNQVEGESHFYELSFTGGPLDASTLSGTLPNGNGHSGVSAVRHQNTNGTGAMDDEIIVTLADEIQTPNLILAMVLQMNNNQANDFGSEGNEDLSGMAIFYNNYILNTISGSSNITNYGENSIGGITYATFKITFSAEMVIGMINQTETLSTQVTGFITVKRLIFN